MNDDNNLPNDGGKKLGKVSPDENNEEEFAEESGKFISSEAYRKMIKMNETDEDDDGSEDKVAAGRND